MIHSFLLPSCFRVYTCKFKNGTDNVVGLQLFEFVVGTEKCRPESDHGAFIFSYTVNINRKQEDKRHEKEFDRTKSSQKFYTTSSIC